MSIYSECYLLESTEDYKKYFIVYNGTPITVATNDPYANRGFIDDIESGKAGAIGTYAQYLAKYQPRYGIPECVVKIEALIQKRLDDFAGTLTYGSMLSACTYATSSNPVYAIEGQYCVASRDATWDAAYAILNSMMAAISGSGKESYTESELAALWSQIEAQLPALAWPEGSRGA